MKKNHLFSFFVIFAADIEHNHNFMKRILKYVLIIAVFAITSLATTGCFRQDLLMFEDGEFDGVEELRALAWTDLDRAMLRAFEISVEMLEQRGRSIDVHSRQALEFMQKQLGI